jgi:hypothetical protein
MVVLCLAVAWSENARIAMLHDVEPVYGIQRPTRQGENKVQLGHLGIRKLDTPRRSIQNIVPARSHGFYISCALQLSHGDILGVVAVWVVRVGGPESFRVYVHSMISITSNIRSQHPSISAFILHLSFSANSFNYTHSSFSSPIDREHLNQLLSHIT